MKTSHQAAGLFAALALGAAAAVVAHPGGMAPHGKAGMQHGMRAGAQQLMTPDERSALMEKMRSAKTPEERHRLAEATRTEMQKRAQEKGITLPDTHTH